MNVLSQQKADHLFPVRPHLGSEMIEKFAGIWWMLLTGRLYVWFPLYGTEGGGTERAVPFSTSLTQQVSWQEAKSPLAKPRFQKSRTEHGWFLCGPLRQSSNKRYLSLEHAATESVLCRRAWLVALVKCANSSNRNHKCPRKHPRLFFAENIL